MANGSTFKTTMTGFGAMALLAAGLAVSLSNIASAQEPSPPLGAPNDPAPVQGKPKPPERGPRDLVADIHVESTVLGFDQGIGPAVGRDVTYNGKLYTVADVATANGQPSFSGGSHFAIAPAGGRLVIGLKMTDPDTVSVALK
jgi:hypothetical protein